VFTKSQDWYDLVYDAQGKDYEVEAATLRQMLHSRGVSRGGAGGRSRLLDVACGTGRHLALLDDFDRVGVDLDPGMLERAAERCPGVMLVEGDMRTLDPGGLGAPFDAVSCLFSSIAYMRDLQSLTEAVGSMARCIRPGGVLAIEPFLEPGVVELGRPWATFVDRPEIKIARMDVPRVEGRCLQLEFEYLIADSDGVRHVHESHRVGLFTREEFGSAFRAAGLEWSFVDPGISGRGLHFGRRPD
jgi:SAM-dependent methyltransferase